MTFMRPDQPQDYEAQEIEKKRLFEELYAEAIAQGPDDFLELRGPFSKQEFLDFVVREKGALLHGSNHQSIDEFEPRQANDAAKEFGNRAGVYAVEDPVLPIFYAIKDQKRFDGRAVSGYERVDTNKKYDFAVSREMLEEKPWSDGAVYILPRETFEQGSDDDDELIDEWISQAPVRPIAKIKVAPEDFEYLDSIQPLDNVLEMPKVQKALDLALSLHADQKARPDGPYIGHIRRVVNRVVDDFGVEDSDIVVAAALHDSVEDQAQKLADKLESPDISLTEQQKAIEYIKQEFGERVAEMVVALSNPEELDALEVQARNKEYARHIEHAIQDLGVFYVKLSDFMV
jgi:hypothetical protein